VEGPVKERLTGALILVAALVVVVPEMLSGPESAAVSEPTDPAAAAAAGPPLRTYSLELGSGDSVNAVQQATLAPRQPDAVAASAQPQLTPVAEPIRVAVPVPMPTLEQKPKEAAAPVVAPAASVKPGQWWTQLGSFASSDNAERLARQLRSAGFAVDVAKINAGGKELHRVRAGPVRDRTEALALQARLAAVGHKTSLVAP
jgi:DedD protein